MEPPPEIRNLKEFLEPSLNGAKVKSFTTKYLTTLGDNYGSTMLAVSVQIEKSNNKSEVLELVAKMIATNKQLFDIFQTETTFIKENAMYTEIFPALLQLQKEMNVPENEIIDALPFCYGARISLDENSMSVDSDAVLLLENLKIKGFIVGDREKGFNYEHVLLILKNLAYFNAMPIALKYLRPKIFHEKIVKNVTRIDIDAALDEEAKHKMTESLYRDIDSVMEIEYELKEKIKKQIEICKIWQNTIDNDNIEITPYTTIVHNDFWVNNMMIGYDKKGHPNAVKIIDFQLMMMESFAHDLLFFIFLSVEEKVFDDKFDELIKYYYDCFINCLKVTKCPLEDFTYEKFLDEIQRRAPYELFHLLVMLKVCLAKKEAIPDFHEFDTDMFLKEDFVGPEYLEKFKKLLQVYVAKNWII